MLQPSKQVTEGTVNNNQTNDIAAQESRRTPKKINYEDYCVTKVSQHNIFVNKFACGSFIENTVIPDDKTSVSMFSVLGDKLNQQVCLVCNHSIHSQYFVSR